MTVSDCSKRLSADTFVLDFYLGEIRIFRHTLTGKRTDFSGFLEPPVDRVAIPPQNSSIRAHYLNSIPIATRQPVMRVASGWLAYTPSQYRHYYLSTDRSFTDYIEGLHAKTRSSLLRKTRRIEATNQTHTFRVFSSESDLVEFHDLAVTLASKTYQQKLFGTGIPASKEYLRKIQKLAQTDSFFGFILYVNNTPAAYTCVPVAHPHVALYDYTGYDSAFGVYSPGIVLQLKIIEFLCANSTIHFYDFCTGEGDHKTLFTHTFALCCNTFLLRATPINAALIFLHWLITGFGGIISLLLSRLHLKAFLKKVIRGHGR